MFSPELELLDPEVTDADVPLPFGPTVRAVGYRFRRAGEDPSVAIPGEQ
jgi:hypothetical protein